MSSYDAIASWYDSTIRCGSAIGDFVISHMLELIGDVSDVTVCDLACGQGHLARLLAQHGAHVTGIDSSSKLIALAQHDEANTPLGIHYTVGDAQRIESLPAAPFQGVVCNLALMDIPDLMAVYRVVWQILQPQGWFLFSITHPCFEAPHALWRTAPDGGVSREIVDYATEGFLAL